MHHSWNKRTTLHTEKLNNRNNIAEHVSEIIKLNSHTVKNEEKMQENFYMPSPIY